MKAMKLMHEPKPEAVNAAPVVSGIPVLKESPNLEFQNPPPSAPRDTNVIVTVNGHVVSTCSWIEVFTRYGGWVVALILILHNLVPKRVWHFLAQDDAEDSRYSDDENQSQDSYSESVEANVVGSLALLKLLAHVSFFSKCTAERRETTLPEGSLFGTERLLS